MEDPSLLEVIKNKIKKIKQNEQNFASRGGETSCLFFR
jgi:hypothetical protein